MRAQRKKPLFSVSFAPIRIVGRASGASGTIGTTHTGTYGQGTADGSYTRTLYAAGGGNDSITDTTATVTLTMN